MPCLPSDPPFLREPRPDYANDPRHRRARTAAWFTGGLALLGALPSAMAGTKVLVVGDATRDHAWLLAVASIACIAAATALLACNGPSVAPARLTWLNTAVAVSVAAQGFAVAVGPRAYAFVALNMCLVPLAFGAAVVGAALALSARNAVAGYPSVAPAIVYVPTEPAAATAPVDPVRDRLATVALVAGGLSLMASVPLTAIGVFAIADDGSSAAAPLWWTAGSGLVAASGGVGLIVVGAWRAALSGFAITSGVAVLSLVGQLIPLLMDNPGLLGAVCACLHVAAIGATGWCAVHTLNIVAPSGGGPREPRRRNAH